MDNWNVQVTFPKLQSICELLRDILRLVTLNYDLQLTKGEYYLQKCGFLTCKIKLPKEEIQNYQSSFVPPPLKHSPPPEITAQHLTKRMF